MSLVCHPPGKGKQKSQKVRQRKRRLYKARVKEFVEKANMYKLCYVFTCLALILPAKRSNPPKKRVSRKIPDKENACRGMPKSKSK